MPNNYRIKFETKDGGNESRRATEVCRVGSHALRQALVKVNGSARWGHRIRMTSMSSKDLSGRRNTDTMSDEEALVSLGQDLGHGQLTTKFSLGICGTRQHGLVPDHAGLVSNSLDPCMA